MVTDAEFQELKAQVEQITRYFDQAPIEDDAVQQSWPRLDRGLSDVQDMARFQHLYGIFDNGTWPYDLVPHSTAAETNSKNTLILTAGRGGSGAESTLRGAFHRLRQDVELAFPAVLEPTTYYVVIEYDPQRSEDGGDPLVEKVVTQLSRTSGRDYLTLWRVPRQPNQLLSDVTPIPIRPRVAQPLYVWEEAFKPDPESVPWGTICLVGATSEFYVARGGTESSPRQWVRVSGTWQRYTSNLYPPAGHGMTPELKINGDKVEIRGRVTRQNGTPFYPGNNYKLIPTLPVPPVGTHRVQSGSDSEGNPVLIAAGNGELNFQVKVTTPWIDTGGLFYYWR